MNKIIREHLAKVFDADFNGFKKEVDDITRSKIDEVQKEGKNGANGANKKEASRDSSPASSSDDSEPSRKRTAAKAKPQPASSDSDNSVDSEDEKPKTKRGKKANSDDDYDLASKVKRGRSANKKEPKPRKTKKVTEKKPKKEGVGYMKKCVVSDDIFHVFGRRFMARSEVVKEMWAYIKKHELYDKKNKQFIVPDETLRPIFKSKFKGFGMMKFLKNHIKDPAHLDADTLAQYTKEDGSSSTSKPEVKDESGSEEKEESGDEEEKPTNSAEKDKNGDHSSNQSDDSSSSDSD
uniref:DM2 domain-containing protein n=1 Tax=Acrobeloides nanus TaxID=290746 RepID=A0A914DUH1_9BILA